MAKQKTSKHMQISICIFLVMVTSFSMNSIAFGNVSNIAKVVEFSNASGCLFNVSDLSVFHKVNLLKVYVDDDYNSSTNGWGYDHFDNILDGVNAVAPDGTVFVHAGRYHDYIVIDKTVNLIGEDKDRTFIIGNEIYSTFYVTANNIKIKGFTFQDCSTGIFLGGSSNNIISNNNFLKNKEAISAQSYSNNNRILCNTFLDNLFAITLSYHSDNNTILNNVIRSSENCGIYLHRSSNNSISKNSLSKNKEDNIFLQFHSNNNTLSKNNIESSEGATGITLQSCCENNTILFNKITANSEYGLHIYNSDNNYVLRNNISENKLGGILIDGNSDENNVSYNIISSNYECGIWILFFNKENVIYSNTIISNGHYGVLLSSTPTETVISKNLISENDVGLSLQSYTSKSTISCNTISNNNFGISVVDGCNYNVIYHNNFFNNQISAYDNCDENSWTNGYLSGGNYWSDFDEPGEGAYDDYRGITQKDIGRDGIVDKGKESGGGINPYFISGGDNNDNYPLMKPYN